MEVLQVFGDLHTLWWLEEIAAIRGCECVIREDGEAPQPAPEASPAVESEPCQG